MKIQVFRLTVAFLSIMMLALLGTLYWPTKKTIYLSDFPDLSQKQVELILRDTNDFYFNRTRKKVRTSTWIADTILNDYIFTYPSFKPVKHSPQLDWEFNPFQNESWQLYYHSLSMVSYLCDGFNEAKDLDYLIKAKSIAKQWIAAFPYGADVDKKRYKYAWNDNSVSNRVLHLTFLLELLKLHANDDTEFIILLNKTIMEHGFWLADNQNYSKYNHGIMQDKSLLQISLLYPYFEKSEEWRILSLARATERFAQDISEGGVHVENSPGYHLIVMELVNDFISILDHYNEPVPAFYTKTFELMKDYAIYMIKPDKSLPPIGDTSGKATLNYKTFPFKNDMVEYLLSSGKRGTKPRHSSKCYQREGIAILRDEWKDSTEFDESTFIFFNNSMLSPVHKHADNLSFYCYSLGKELFIDGGHYSYSPSPMTTYLRSAFAHNTLVVNGESFKVDKSSVDKAAILDFMSNQEFDYIQAGNYCYNTVDIYRTLLFIKPNIIVLLDKVVDKPNLPDSLSTAIISTEQIFNVSSELRYKIGRDKVVELSDNEINVTISQLEDINSLRLFNGSENPLRGFAAEKPNTTISIPQIVYQTSGKSKLVFKTIIEMKSPKYGNPASDVNIVTENRQLKVSYKRGGLPRQSISVDPESFTLHREQ